MDRELQLTLGKLKSPKRMSLWSVRVSVVVVTGLRGNIDQTKDDRDFMMHFYWNNFNVGWWQEMGCWDRIVNGNHDPTLTRSPVRAKNLVPSWEKFFVCYMVREPWFCHSNNVKWRWVSLSLTGNIGILRHTWNLYMGCLTTLRIGEVLIMYPNQFISVKIFLLILIFVAAKVGILPK